MISVPTACHNLKTDKLNTNQTFDWGQFAGKEIFLLLDDHPWTEGLKPYLSDFETLTNLKINIKIVPEPEYFKVMESTLEDDDDSGEIDVFFLPMDSTAYRLWRKNLLHPLTPLINNPKLTELDYNFYDFPENFRLAGTYPPGESNQNLFGIPATFEAYILFYNKTLINQYLNGLVPKTMAELVEASLKIKERGEGKFFGTVMRGIPSDTIIDTVTGIILNHWGSEPSNLPYNIWFDNDWKQPRLTDKRIMAGLRNYAQLMQAGPPNIKEIDWPEATRLFQEGKAAFYIGASLFGPDFDNPKLSKIAGNVGYTVLPSSGEQSLTGHWLWGLGIAKKSKNPEAGWLFIQWATSQMIEQKIGVMTGGAPRFSSWVTPSVYTEAMNIDYALAVQTAMKTSRPTVVLHPRWDQGAKAIATTIHRIYDGANEESAVAELQTQIKQIMSDFPEDY
ncbi:extracellular solute-binding protein [Crocosphaera chwakensis]|nr:extracellular solute-binding protein [Crocosphaera chwakensis]